MIVEMVLILLIAFPLMLGFLGVSGRTRRRGQERGAGSGGALRTHTKTVNISYAASSTPGAYGTEGSIKLGKDAAHLTSMLVQVSVDLQTTVETVQPGFRITSEDWSGNHDFMVPEFKAGGIATNEEPIALPATEFPLDYVVSANTTVKVAMTELMGATVTGACYATVSLTYWNGNPGQGWLDLHAAKCGFTASIRWAGAGVSVACATTTRTALTAITIPAWVTLITDVIIAFAIEGAETASQQLGGHVELDYGQEGQGDQKFPFGQTRHPELGSQVNTGGSCRNAIWSTHVPLPNDEVTLTPHGNLLAAVTNGRAAVGVFGY